MKAIVEAVFGRVIFTETTRAAYLRFWSASLSNPRFLAINREAYLKDVQSLERLIVRATKRRAQGFRCTPGRDRTHGHDGWILVGYVPIQGDVVVEDGHANLLAISRYDHGASGSR